VLAAAAGVAGPAATIPELVVTNKVTVGRSTRATATAAISRGWWVMERTRELGSALLTALVGLGTAVAFVGLYAALSAPVWEVLDRLV
jgi:hypothetical protein